MTTILRQLPTDSDFVKQRLMVLQRWIVENKVEPWVAVVMAEWVRTPAGRKGELPSMEQLEDLYESDAFEAMREQADGPWMIYHDQARGQKANRFVMTFLSALEDAMGADAKQ